MAKAKDKKKEYKCSECGTVLLMSDDDTGECPKCGKTQSVSTKG